MCCKAFSLGKDSISVACKIQQGSEYWVVEQYQNVIQAALTGFGHSTGVSSIPQCPSDRCLQLWKNVQVLDVRWQTGFPWLGGMVWNSGVWLWLCREAKLIQQGWGPRTLKHTNWFWTLGMKPLPMPPKTAEGLQVMFRIRSYNFLKKKIDEVLLKISLRSDSFLIFWSLVCFVVSWYVPYFSYKV